jgi:hypothetical protein
MGAREVGDGDDRWEGGKEGPEMADGRWEMGDGGLVTKMRMCGPFSFASYHALGSRPWTWELGDGKIGRMTVSRGDGWGIVKFACWAF